jgi:hypothetical protein
MPSKIRNRYGTAGLRSLGQPSWRISRVRYSVDPDGLRRGRSGSRMSTSATHAGCIVAEVGLIIPPPSTRASRADQAHGVKVVQPVGCSTLTPWAGPAPLPGGSTVTG